MSKVMWQKAASPTITLKIIIEFQLLFKPLVYVQTEKCFYRIISSMLLANEIMLKLYIVFNLFIF